MILKSVFRAWLVVIGLAFHSLVTKVIMSSHANPMLWDLRTWGLAIAYFTLMTAFFALALHPAKVRVKLVERRKYDAGR